MVRVHGNKQPIIIVTIGPCEWICNTTASVTDGARKRKYRYSADDLLIYYFLSCDLQNWFKMMILKI